MLMWKNRGGVCLWERGKQRDMHVYVCAHASRVIRSSCGLESVVRWGNGLAQTRLLLHIFIHSSSNYHPSQSLHSSTLSQFPSLHFSTVCELPFLKSVWFQQLLLSSLSSLTFFHIPLFFFYDVGRLTFFNSLVSFTSWLHWLRVPVLMSGGSVCACLLLQDFKNESWKRFFTSQRYETESELGFSFPMSKKPNCFWITATLMVSQKAVSQCNLWSGSQNVAYICFVFLSVSELVRLRVIFFLQEWF